MPAKGEIYNRIDVRLERWLEDHMMRYNLNQSDIARRLNLNRGRISQMSHGQLNTEKYLDIVVHNAEGGNYLTMMKYATSRDAELRLQELQHKKGLDREGTLLWETWMLEGMRISQMGNKEMRDAIEKLREVVNGQPRAVCS